MTARYAAGYIGCATAGEIARLLRQSREGDPEVMGALLALVYAELRRIAQGHPRRYDANLSLQPTELINEAWIKLAESDSPEWKDRVHFFAFTAAVIRNILVDHARTRLAQKRGGEAVRIPLEDALAYTENRPSEILALDAALTRLEHIDHRKALSWSCVSSPGLTSKKLRKRLACRWLLSGVKPALRRHGS